MAAIDKIYATKDKRQEFYTWSQEHAPAAVSCFYEWYTEWDAEPEKERPITNFTEAIDLWMMENCPIEWVVNYIKWQYGEA